MKLPTKTAMHQCHLEGLTRHFASTARPPQLQVRSISLSPGQLCNKAEVEREPGVLFDRRAAVTLLDSPDGMVSA